MNVFPLTERYYDAYHNYLERHPTSLFYHSLRYRSLLDRLLPGEPRYLIARHEGSLCGILPLMETSDERGSIINSLPFFGSNGGIFASDAEAKSHLIHSYNEIASAATTRAATFIENPFDDYDYGGISATTEDERIVQYTDLSSRDADEDHLMQRYSGSGRRNIRKARREGVSVARDAGALDALREIHQENMEAKGGRAKNDRYFQLLPEVLRPDRDFTVYTARAGGEVVAALLLYFFNRTVEYYIPATRVEARSLQPMPLIILTAMRRAASDGYSRWNWGGTWLSQKGVYRFKRKWGSKETRYNYLIQVNDESLFASTPRELTTAYPHYYTVPFSQLKTAEVIHE